MPLNDMQIRRAKPEAKAYTFWARVVITYRT